MNGHARTGALQRALDVTGERAADASRMKSEVEALTLVEMTQALDPVCDVLERFWEMSGLLSARLEQLRDREVPGEPVMVAVEAALTHLRVGREALMAGFHLHELGRVVLEQTASGPAAGER